MQSIKRQAIKGNDTLWLNSNTPQRSIKKQLVEVPNRSWACRAQLTSSGMNAAFCVVTQVFSFALFPFWAYYHRRENLTWQRCWKLWNDWESRENMGTGAIGRKDYLTLPLSPRTAAGSSPSLLFISTPLLAKMGPQSLERQSDMSSVAGYQGLIKGGWQSRIEPKSRRKRFAGWELTVPRLCFIWLEVISYIIREMAHKSTCIQPCVGTLFMTFFSRPFNHSTRLLAGIAVRRKRMIQENKLYQCHTNSVTHCRAAQKSGSEDSKC